MTQRLYADQRKTWNTQTKGGENDAGGIRGVKTITGSKAIRMDYGKIKTKIKQDK